MLTIRGYFRIYIAVVGTGAMIQVFRRMTGNVANPSNIEQKKTKISGWVCL
jgi:hypothetical protein